MITVVPTDLRVSARIEPVALEPSGVGTLVADVSIPDGCHIQSHEPGEPFLIPTELRLEPSEGLRIGEIAYPEGTARSFDWTPVVLRIYGGTIRITVPVRVDDDATPGQRRISGTIRYQTCTESLCYPPTERSFIVTLEVGSS
jgi:DsbC/DsbD-like thiol-disulfide interchange protein